MILPLRLLDPTFLRQILRQNRLNTNFAIDFLNTMTKVFSYEYLTAWIEKQTNDIQRCKYGRNLRSLQQGLNEQKRYLEEIVEIEITVSQLLTNTCDSEKKQRLQESYYFLKALIEKKIHCLETMLLVTELEKNCSRVSRDFDLRSVSIVNDERLRKTTKCNETKATSSTDSGSVTRNNLAGFIGTASQDCINGLRNNWDWIAKLVKCVDIHLKNSSEYQQFFHEIEESEQWMLEDFSRFARVLDSHSSKTTNDDVADIAADLDTIHVSLRQWEAKANRLLKTASSLVPVPLRTDGITEPTPATSLCDYETTDISFASGEDILLLSNSNVDSWKVRNGKGEEADVPSVIVLIPGPSKEAIDNATRLQFQLLTTWTNALKRLGVRLLCHLLVAFKPEYNTREIAALSSMEDIDKEHLLKLLMHIEEILRNYWSEHEGFLNLQERLLALRMALEEIGEDDQKDADLYKSLIVEITALGQIMNIYQDMFKNWEKLKVAVETSRAPELMLIVDKWEQLQFVSREYFSKFWKMTLPLDEREKSIMRTDFVAETLNESETNITADISNSSTHETKENTLIDETGFRPDPIRDIENKSLYINEVTEESSKVNELQEKETKITNRSNGVGRGILTEKDANEMEEVFDGRTAWHSDETVMTERVIYGAEATEADRNEGEKESPTGTVRKIESSIRSHAEVKGSEFDDLQEIGFSDHKRLSSSEYEGSMLGIASETKTAETEQLSSAEMEENRTFVIRSVVNPSDQTEISLEQAIMLGVIRPNDGVYVNTTNGVVIPIATAMTDGLIHVMFSTTKRTQEKFSSIGIITIKTIRKTTRPCSIVSVRDALNDENISQEEAQKREILDEQQGFYTNRLTGKKMMISEAVDEGMVVLDNGGEQREPEVISKTYAVRAVVDRRLKKTITFHEAVRRGIIDKESGAFRDTMTNEKMYVGDAIMRGFLKARIIEDAHGLNIDPQNKMVIDKTKKIRDRLLKPLKVISAFKMAAKDGAKK